MLEHLDDAKVTKRKSGDEWKMERHAEKDNSFTCTLCTLDCPASLNEHECVGKNMAALRNST